MGRLVVVVVSCGCIVLIVLSEFIEGCWCCVLLVSANVPIEARVKSPYKLKSLTEFGL